MKTGVSSLNPYASPYIPLSKSAGADLHKGFSSAQELNRGNEAATQFGNQSENILLPRSQHQNISRYDGTVSAAAGDFSKWRDHSGSEYLTLTSQHVDETMLEEKPNFDEDMDLAFLQMTFPGISYDSLHGVYLTSRRDLDAAVDMINELEIHPNKSSDKLPDTLDIGDVPESGSQKAEGASNSG